MLEPHPHVDALEQARDERDLEAELVAAADDRDQRGVRPARGQEGEHHVLRAGPGDDLLELIRPAQNRRLAPRDLVVAGRIGVYEAHGPKPQLGVLLEPPLDLRADAAGAKDEGAPGDGALRTRAPLRHREHVAAAGHVDHPERPDACKELRLARDAVRERDERDDHHRGHRARAHHVPGLVQVLDADLVPVEPANREEADHERRE